MRSGRAVQAAFAVAFTLVAPGDPASAGALSGRAEVIDGDTIAIAGVGPRIRLYGLDAPEGRQTCLDAAGAPPAGATSVGLALRTPLRRSSAATVG